MKLDQEQIEGIVRRVAYDRRLKLPDQKLITVEERATYIKTIIQQRPLEFLERHGYLLTTQEKKLFPADYHLSPQPDKQQNQPSPTTIRNRRLAALHRLIDQEEHFTDYSMRRREPDLHFQYIGRHQPPTERITVPPRTTTTTATTSSIFGMTESIIRRHEEHDVVLQHRGSNDDANAGFGITALDTIQQDQQGRSYEEATTEQREEYSHFFLDMMKQKFLSGEDSTIDYRGIDYNEELDMGKEEVQDIEDRYFDE